jgi:DNA-3-methyladenine glycosylase II
MAKRSDIDCSQWEKAVQYLAKVDPVMRQLIKATGPCTVRPRRDYFVVLCNAIFSQQISTKVAAVLFGRFRNKFPNRRPTPKKVVEFLTAANEQQIRACGLSRQKQSYVLDLAKHFADGKIPTRRFRNMSDEEIIESLTAVRGIGRWTVEMFLIFVLNRTDVLPVDDFGLRGGFQRAYGLRKHPTPVQMRRRAESWRPYRSVGTWYLWRQPKPAKK